MDPEVLKVFIDETNEIMTGLEKAIAEHDLEPIHRLAHTLKGNAAQFGFPDLSQAAKEMEYLARDIRAGEKKLTKEVILVFNNMKGKLVELCQKVKS